MKNYLKLIKNNLELIKKNFHKKIHSNQQLRIFIALNLFYEMEKLMYLKKINHENYYKFVKNMKLISDISKKYVKQDLYKSKVYTNTLFEKNSETFYNVWKNFDKSNIKVDGYKMLKKRLQLNKINPKYLIKDKICVDAGCGSGRYSGALLKFGAKKVISFDKNSRTIDQAKKNFKSKKISFHVGDNISPKIKENSIDFIFSNGVIHHDYNIDKQLRSLSKLLKKGGLMWLYVNGRMGLFSEIVDTCRELLKDVKSYDLIWHLNKHIKNKNKIYWYLDYLLPVYFWQDKKKFEKKIKKYFKIVKFLNKGIKTDQSQILNSTKNKTFNQINFGQGMLKYILSKS
jgi:ubiquinone/menaquinone biosynthesis C-methylase UbiE